MWRNRLVTLKNIFKWRNVRWWQVKILTSYPSKCQIKKEDMTVILLRIFFKGAGYSLGWWESYRRYFRNNSTVNDPSTWRLDGSFVSGLWEILRNCYGAPSRALCTIDGTGKQMLICRLWTSDTFPENKGFNVWENLRNFISYRSVLISWNTIWFSVWNMMNLFIIHFLPIHC